MQKLHYSIFIKAPKQKVWETMLNDDTYRQWTAEFNPAGSYYEGGWETGSDIKFLGPEKDGTVSGMIAKIKESRPYDYVSIQHMGEINKGEEKMYKPDSESFENYTLNEINGGTEVLVDLISSDSFPHDYESMFQEAWPKALDKLKALAEQ